MSFGRIFTSGYSFLQTSLGSNLASATVGGIITYGISYTQNAEERRKAEEKCNLLDMLNRNLSDQNTTLTTLVADVSSKKETVSANFTQCNHELQQRQSDINLIKTLHANSWFKPNIDHIGNGNGNSTSATSTNVAMKKS